MRGEKNKLLWKGKSWLVLENSKLWRQCQDVSPWCKALRANKSGSENTPQTANDYEPKNPNDFILEVNSLELGNHRHKMEGTRLCYLMFICDWQFTGQGMLQGKIRGYCLFRHIHFATAEGLWISDWPRACKSSVFRPFWPLYLL